MALHRIQHLTCFSTLDQTEPMSWSVDQSTKAVSQQVNQNSHLAQSLYHQDTFEIFTKQQTTINNPIPPKQTPNIPQNADTCWAAPAPPARPAAGVALVVVVVGTSDPEIQSSNHQVKKICFV